MKIKLQTLFIFVTVAILLTVFVLKSTVPLDAEKRSREKLRTLVKSVEFTTRNGATTSLSCIGEPGGIQSVDTKTLAVLRDLDSLWIQSCHVKNVNKMEILQMRELTLVRARLDQEIPMPNLKKLFIERSGIGLSYTPSENRPVPDGFDFKPFREAKSLEEILIKDDFVTNFHGLEFLGKLSTIMTDRARIYSIEGVDLIESLEHLNIASEWQREMPPADIAALCRCKSLKSLKLPERMPQDSIEQIKKALPDCEILLKQ